MRRLLHRLDRIPGTLGFTILCESLLQHRNTTARLPTSCNFYAMLIVQVTFAGIIGISSGQGPGAHFTAHVRPYAPDAC